MLSNPVTLFCCRLCSHASHEPNYEAFFSFSIQFFEPESLELELLSILNCTKMIWKHNLKALVNILSPAYAAALALIAIQVSIGLLYKASQTNGK